MDDIQYQQRRKSYSDDEILAEMASLVGEAYITKEEFHFLQDFRKIYRTIQNTYKLKYIREKNHHLSLLSLIAEDKIKKLSEFSMQFCWENNNLYEKLLSDGRKLMKKIDENKGQQIVCNFRKKHYGGFNLYGLPESSINEEIRSILATDKLHFNSYFENLIYDTTSYLFSLHINNESSFLTSSHISLIDTIIFTSFANCKSFLLDIDHEDLVQRSEYNYYKNTINVVSALLPIPRETIEDIFKNRIELYRRIYNSSYPIGIERLYSVILKFQLVLIQDFVFGEYQPLTDVSNTNQISVSEIMKCIEEINNYLALFTELYDEDIHEINNNLQCSQDYWVEYEEDEQFSILPRMVNSRPINSRMFEALYSALEKGLNYYYEKQNNTTIYFFTEALLDNLISFASGTKWGCYSFYISSSSGEGIEFHMDERTIEVICGGMLHDEYGADSYTNWRYIIWRNGEEESDYASIDSFDDIVQMFYSDNVNFSIAEPDRYEYDSEKEELYRELAKIIRSECTDLQEHSDRIWQFIDEHNLTMEDFMASAEGQKITEEAAEYRFTTP